MIRRNLPRILIADDHTLVADMSSDFMSRPVRSIT